MDAFEPEQLTLFTTKTLYSANLRENSSDEDSLIQEWDLPHAQNVDEAVEATLGLAKFLQGSSGYSFALTEEDSMWDGVNFDGEDVILYVTSRDVFVDRDGNLL